MISEIKKYPNHYLALAIILVLGLASLLMFRFDPLLKKISIYSLAGLYVLWGVFHHHSLGHLRLKVVLEYLVVALLAIVIISNLI